MLVFGGVIQSSVFTLWTLNCYCLLPRKNIKTSSGFDEFNAKYQNFSQFPSLVPNKNLKIPRPQLVFGAMTGSWPSPLRCCPKANVAARSLEANTSRPWRCYWHVLRPHGIQHWFWHLWGLVGYRNSLVNQDGYQIPSWNLLQIAKRASSNGPCFIVIDIVHWQFCGVSIIFRAFTSSRTHMFSLANPVQHCHCI